MNAVLSKDGLTVDTANDEQLDGALGRVDGVMEALTERAKELGVAIGLSLAEEEAADLPLIDDDDRSPNTYLQDLADRVAMIAQSLASLDRIYGPEGRESLENGAGLKLYITPRDQRTVKEVSAAVGSTTREAVTRMYGRNKGILGATSTSARLEERPLLSETEARLMDPDEVIILASPQHPIKAQRIKYYYDPLFKAMDAKQKDKPFPYLPGVEGVGPWGVGGDEDREQGANDTADHLPARDRAERREARGMRVMVEGVEMEQQPVPETLERDAAVPKAWEQTLDMREEMIEELLSG